MSEETARTVALAHAMNMAAGKGVDQVLEVAQRYYEFLTGRQLREVSKAA